METLNKNKLRLIFVDILNGYTISYFKNTRLYFKHNSSVDAGDIDYKKEEFIIKARSSGLPTEEDKLNYLIKENLWSKDKDEKIKKIKSYIHSLRTTKSKLFKNDDILYINNQIKEENTKLLELVHERKDLIGFTVEDYANRRINEYYMFNSLFKDKEFKDRLFSKDEFDDLDDGNINDISNLYKDINLRFHEKILKKISLSPYYLNLFNISEENPYYLYGKPIINLTFYQIEVFGYARYFKNILSEAKHKPPDEYYDDPEKLVEWVESSKNAEEMLNKNQRKNAGNNNEGAVATSIVGAKREDLAKIGVEEKGINLHDEAAKKGGVLDMKDLMKLHGI